jgi:hypothetical protein
MKKYCNENFVPIMVGMAIAFGINIIVSVTSDTIIKIAMVLCKDY